SWITRIALNAAMMRRRRARAHEEYDTVTEIDRSQDTVLPFPRCGTDQPDAALGQRQVKELLERAVAELPFDLRLVFLPSESEGMSTRDVARGVSLNAITVKTRLLRARLLLRRSVVR